MQVKIRTVMILDMFSAKVTFCSYRIKDIALMLFVIAKLEICLIKELIFVDVTEHFCGYSDFAFADSNNQRTEII